jgi:outer membrane lipoprotein carrier protein
MRRVLTVLGVLAAAASPVRAQDTAGERVIARAAASYRGLSSLAADFRQVIDDPMIGLLESAGRVVQAGNDRLAMRFTDPPGEAIIMDGHDLWLYTPSTTPGQVVRVPLPDRPSYGFNVLAWILDRPTERYRIEATRTGAIDGVPVDVVELVPVSGDLPFTRATIWLGRADALPRQLEIRERGGSTRTITLWNLRPNAPAPAGTFTFAVPRGVRVVEQQG